MYGITYPNLTGGIAVMNTNHHLTKPVLIGEIQDDGQFEIVWETPKGVIGDAWTDYLPESANLVADWTAPIILRKLQHHHGQVLGPELLNLG